MLNGVGDGTSRWRGSASGRSPSSTYSSTRLKNWGLWGPDDTRGTLNYITPEHVRRAASLVRTGRSISLSLPVNKVAGPDNPTPGHPLHGHRPRQRHRLGQPAVCHRLSRHAVPWRLPHPHRRPLPHRLPGPALQRPAGRAGDAPPGRTPSTSPATPHREWWASGVLLDIPRLRGVRWLEPGTAVSRAELEAGRAHRGVRLGEGDLFVFRTGHHRRRLRARALGQRIQRGGQGRPACRRHVAAARTSRGGVPARWRWRGDAEHGRGIAYPVHPLQITAMGMLASDSLDLEELAEACAAEQRWEFLVVLAPLRVPRATGSPFNPIAVM